jgi:hypothetical protein
MFVAMALAGPRRTETTSSSGAVGALMFLGSWAGIGAVPGPVSGALTPSRAGGRSYDWKFAGGRVRIGRYARGTVGGGVVTGVEGFEQGPPLGVNRVLVLLVTLVQFVNEPLVSAKFLW